MCGKLRIYSTDKKRSNIDMNKTGAETKYWIPHDSKNVCTACNIAVWVALGSEVELKWCKECNAFRPWPAFGENITAVTCGRCRNRRNHQSPCPLLETRSGLTTWYQVQLQANVIVPRIAKPYMLVLRVNSLEVIPLANMKCFVDLDDTPLSLVTSGSKSGRFVVSK